jgi:hypothetical protein
MKQLTSLDGSLTDATVSKLLGRLAGNLYQIVPRFAAL